MKRRKKVKPRHLMWTLFAMIPVFLLLFAGIDKVLNLSWSAKLIYVALIIIGGILIGEGGYTVLKKGAYGRSANILHLISFGLGFLVVYMGIIGLVGLALPVFAEKVNGVILIVTSLVFLVERFVK